MVVDRRTHVLLAVVAATLVAGCAPSDRGLYALADLRPGDCFDLPADVLYPEVDEPVPVVSCAEPHDYEVFEVLEYVVVDPPNQHFGPPVLPAWQREAVDRCEFSFGSTNGDDVHWSVLYDTHSDRADVVCVYFDSRRRKLVGRILR